MKRSRIFALCAAVLLALSLLSGCSGGAGEEKRADLSAFAQSLVERYEFASWLEELDPEEEETDGYIRQSIEEYLPGLLDMELPQRVIYMSTMRLNNGEFSMVQAKSPQDAAKAAEIFQARIDYMAGDGETPGGAFYPGPTELWQNNARVEVHGSYVLMVTAEECDQIVEEFKALFA